MYNNVDKHNYKGGHEILKKNYYLFILISIAIIIIFTGCENKDAQIIGEDTTEDIVDEIELIEDTEDENDEELYTSNGETSAKDVRDAFLKAIDEEDYKGFRNCINRTDVSKEEFKAYIKALNTKVKKSNGEEISLIRLNIEKTLDNAVEYFESGQDYNALFGINIIKDDNDRFKIEIEDGKYILTDIKPKASMKIENTGQVFSSDEEGKLSAQLFPGEYNAVILLETPRGNIELEEEITIHGGTELESTLSQYYEMRYLSLSEATNTTIIPEGTNIFLGEWLSEDGDTWMYFGNSNDYHFYHFGDYYENYGTGPVTIRIDGINQSCDFEIINHKEIILNCYSVPLEAEYYFHNGDLYIDGKKFIRQ